MTELFDRRTMHVMRDEPRPYPTVRALARGLALLAELNRLGRAAPATLAKATGIDRTTAYRLLATLEEEGYVGRSPSDGQYMLLFAVHQLSRGYIERDTITRIVAPELRRLLSIVLWPSDFMTFEAGSMVVRETTHPFSPYSTHRGMVGRSLSLLDSAAGRAVLAASSEQERATMLQIAQRAGGVERGEQELDATVAHLLADYERRGYTWSVGGWEPHISAIALPVTLRSRVVGAINIVFYRSALTVDAAVLRYLEPLRRCVLAVEEQLSNEIDENI
jgi:IclR family mhp operon transcriptional activator